MALLKVKTIEKYNKNILQYERSPTTRKYNYYN